jgi:cytochrome P450
MFLAKLHDVPAALPARPARPAAARRAPSPPTEGLLGHLGPVHRDELGYLLRAARELGPVVRLRFGHLPAHLISGPEGVRRVLLDNQENYDKKSRGYTKLREFLGDGLLTSEGDHWRRQRAIATPAFHPKRIAGFGDVFARYAGDLVEELLAHAATPGASHRDTAADMTRLTLRIVGTTLMSADLTGDADEVGRALTVCLHEIDRRISNPLPFLERLPTPRNRRFDAACRSLDGIVRRVIGERRGAPADGRPEDLLTMLMDARDEVTGEGMTDDQLRDELLTILLAGHETTANALAWTLHLLSAHPEVRRRLEAEVDAVVGDRLPGADDFGRLVYTRQVIQEAMRLYPPAWIISRQTRARDEVLGYEIPAGSLVFVSPWVTASWSDRPTAPAAGDADQVPTSRNDVRLRPAESLNFGVEPVGAVVTSEKVLPEFRK